MTIGPAAQRLGISRSKLYQLVTARRIAHYRVGGKIIFHDEDLAAFLAGCLVPANTTQQQQSTPHLKLKHVSLNRGQ